MAHLPPLPPSPPPVPGARIPLKTHSTSPEETAQQALAASVLDKLREMIAASTVATDTMLGAIAVAAHSLTEAGGSAIAMPRDGVVVCVGRSGDTAPELGTRLNLDAGISGECLRSGRILCCGDVAKEFHIDPEVCSDMGLKSIAAVPLRGQKGRIGVLEAFSPEAHAFSDDQMELLGRLAGLAEAAWAREEGAQDPSFVEATDRAPAEQDHHASEALERVGEALATGLHAELVAERRWRYATVVVLAVLLLLLLAVFAWRAWYKASLQSIPGRTASSRGLTQESPDSATGAALGKPSALHPAARPDALPTEQPVKSAALKEPEIAPRRPLGAASLPQRPGKPGAVIPPDSQPSSLPASDQAPQIAQPGTSEADLEKALSTTPSLPRLETPIAQGLAGGILVHKVQPVYPAEAIKAHLEGVVVLDLTITQRGQVEDVRRVSGPWLLVNAAAAAVGQWRFIPYVLDGRPIRKQTRVTITFKLAQ